MARACYQDNYLQGSFKGVQFEALDVSSEHGRRGAEGEFPFGETTAYADLGRKIRRYSISGRFAENSHIADAEALIAVVETPGPGILVHPTRGVLTVACSSLQIHDNIDEEQGVTYFDAEFVEANFFAGGFSFGTELFGISLTPLFAALELSFNERYRPDSVRWYQSAAVVDTAAEAVAQVATAYQKATSSNPGPRVWALLNDFRTIANDPFTIRQPEQLSLALKNGMTYVDGATAGQRKIDVFRTLVNWASKTSGLTAEAAESQDAIYNFVRTGSTGYIVRGILETPVTTLNAALEQYDMVMSILNEEAAFANSDCYDPRLFLAIRDFIVTTQKSLLHRAYELPAVVEYVFPGATHALVAANEIYGDAKRSRELEMRNPQYLPWSVGPQVVATRVQ